MNTNFQEILEKVAKKNHTTPEEVYRQMQLAIDEAYDNPDPEIQKNWKALNIKGNRPTPEEVIFGVGMMLSPGDGKAH